MFYCLTEIELGVFAVGWTARGIARLALPGRTAEDAIKRIERAGAERARPDAVMEAVCTRIGHYAAGFVDAFADVELDLDGVSDFNRRCYDAIRCVAWGETTTYGAIARQLGDVGLSRAVGAAMGANPIPLIVPCHRVLASDGRPGGFSAPGGVDAKLRMLALERAATPDGQLRLDF